MVSKLVWLKSKSQSTNQRFSVYAKDPNILEGILGAAFLETIAKLLKRLDRYRVIFDRDDNEPYLERYYLFLKNRKSFAFNITLHRILKSDLDDLHDHPWPWVTVILKGGYWEHTRAGNKPKWKGPGCVTIRSSRSLGMSREYDLRCYRNALDSVRRR